MLTQSEVISQLQKQNHELKVLIGVLIERAGGDVLVTLPEILVSRQVGHEAIGMTGTIRLTASRP